MQFVLECINTAHSTTWLSITSEKVKFPISTVAQLNCLKPLGQLISDNGLFGGLL
jgi:hypothetical protein